MKRGNEIHDELFEGEGVDVAVEDAVNMAGALCFVNSVGQGYDMFGHDCEDQLATVFEMLCTTQQSRCYAVVSSGRTMLLIVNEDGSCMIVDSHKHINHGAVIAYCPSNSVKMLAKWLRAMMQRTWQIDLRFCSVTPIFYVTPYSHSYVDPGGWVIKVIFHLLYTYGCLFIYLFFMYPK